MNLRFAVIEKMLSRAQSRHKWVRVLCRTFILGSILCLLALLFDFAVQRRFITGRTQAIAICLVIAGLGLASWLVLMITALAAKADRGWLAAKLERMDGRFLDRLNTLLFLEKKSGDPKAGSFAIKIAQQTKKAFGNQQPRSPFSLKRAGIVFATFVVLLAFTVGVYHQYSPWPRLAAAARSRPAARQDARNLELAPPATNNLEENKNWGEVRITDPGCDLKVTKVDVVPLQIEAAANEALSRVGWFSTINGALETPHELPPPAEPRYAAYQPTLYLDELRLADWDLMTYYAKANTEKENSFASEVYFLEVRPFREDILKLPGGEGGKAYKVLNEITALINRQEHVIRQTHQHIQKPPPLENLQAQDRKKLSDAESDLGDSTSHLYAEMAAEMENAPIGVALDNLAKAAHSLDDSSDLLKQNSLKEAPGRERDALTELVAARKMFQKAVSENPGAFGESGDSNEAPPKLAIDETKKLQKMAEFRNEAKAGRDFIQKAIDEQRRIEQGARSSTNRPGPGTMRNDLQALAARERRLEQSFEDFQQQHPQVFNNAASELDKTRQSMQKAAEEMQSRNQNSATAAAQATKDLQNLSNAMNGGSASQQLADAYRLKQMLDDQIRKMDDFSSAASNNIPNMDPAQTARDARETVNQLKTAAEQEPTRDAFAQPLRDSLSGTNKVDIDAKLAQLEQAQDQPSQQQRAGEARDALSRVSKAFGASQPKSLQMAHKSDALKPDAKDSFNLGLSQLDSLAKQLEQKKLSPENQSKQGQEALYNLQTGLRSFNGDNERGNQIMLHLEELLKSKDPVEVEDLRKLLSELQHFSVESSDHLAKGDDPEVTNIDPAKLPPAYRGRIQKYFQKLSEK